MYSQTHFPGTTHELLCVCAGRARLCFGILTGWRRGGTAYVVVVPAGHRLLEEEGGGFSDGKFHKMLGEVTLNMRPINW